MHEVPTGGVPRPADEILFKTYDGNGVPGNLEPRELVDIRLRNGELRFGLRAEEVRWSRLGWPDDVEAWRRAVGVTKALVTPAVPEVRKHSHYFKDVSHLDTIDVYRVLSLFNVTDQALGHAIKKLLVAGGRGAGKDVTRDVQEAVDTLQRFLEMRNEDCIGE